MASQQARKQTTSQVMKAMKRAAQTERVHIQLRNLPRTAAPSDIRRVLKNCNVSNVKDVYISYHRLQPTGNAYVQFTHPDFVPAGVKALQNSSISSFKLDVLSSPPPAHEPVFRSRGSKGREEAAGRGVLSGLTMEGGGVQGAERSVVLWGLPGKLSSDDLFNHLNSSYKLSGADSGKKEVYQVELPASNFSVYSRFFVRLANKSEAHRLVRELHMTYYRQKDRGERYKIHARLIR